MTIRFCQVELVKEYEDHLKEYEQQADDMRKKIQRECVDGVLSRVCILVKNKYRELMNDS